jgi:hypothetical protein
VLPAATATKRQAAANAINQNDPVDIRRPNYLLHLKIIYNIINKIAHEKLPEFPTFISFDDKLSKLIRNELMRYLNSCYLQASQED